MGVLDTQRVRRRKGNRFTRKDNAPAEPRTTGWSRRKKAAPEPKAYQERTEYRISMEERQGRTGAAMETVAAGAVFLAGAGARLAGRGAKAGAGLTWRATRAGAILAGRGLRALAAAAVALAGMMWQATLAVLRGLGIAARRAQPHVKRGAKVSLEASVQGARASAQMGRRAARYSAVQIRTQADDMKDGFPDVRQGATLARQGAKSLGARAVDAMRQRGWLARPPWRRVLRNAGVVAGTMAAGWLLAVAAVVIPPAVVQSDAFAVEDIDVMGHDRVEADAILAAAGVEPGDNLLAVELERVADDVRALPWVEGVQMRRRYPDRLCISVTERQPVLLLADHGLWFVDGQGEVFKRVESDEWIDLPVITGLTLDDRGVDPEGSRQRLREAVGVVEAFDASRALDAEDIGELHLLPAGGYVVRTTRDGVALRLDEVDYRRGLTRLDTLLERDLLSLVAVEQVDLSLQNQVVATRKVEL